MQWQPWTIKTTSAKNLSGLTMMLIMCIGPFYKLPYNHFQQSINNALCSSSMISYLSGPPQLTPTLALHSAHPANGTQKTPDISLSACIPKGTGFLPSSKQNIHNDTKALPSSQYNHCHMAGFDVDPTWNALPQDTRRSSPILAMTNHGTNSS